MKDIPENWSRTRLADISEIIRGVTYKKPQASESSLEGHLPILRATNIQENHLVLDQDLIFVPQDLVSEKQQLREGDIVVATSSGSKHLVGKTAQVKKSWAGSFGAFCAAIRPSAGIDHHYLGYFFESREYKDFIAKQALGVNINNLRRGDLEEISVPIAPLEQQKRIVEEIEKQFSRLDEAVANLKRVKANLKRYKAAVLKAAVEGKLTEEWRKQNPDVEPASKLLERILAERRQKWEEAELVKMKSKGKAPKDDNWKKKYKEPGPFDSRKLSILPEDWLWTSIESIGFVQLGRQRSPRYHSGPNMKPYLRVQNVFEDRIDLDDVMEMDFPPEDYRKYKVEPGDILLNEGQSPEFLGRPAIFCGEHPDICFTNTLIRFRVYQPMLPEYPLLVFRAYMSSGRFTAEGTITTNIAHLSVGRFSQIEYPLPPLLEQIEIVKEAERRLSIINMLDNKLDKERRRAERLRQSILTTAFSGKLAN